MANVNKCVYQGFEYGNCIEQLRKEINSRAVEPAKPAADPKYVGQASQDYFMANSVKAGGVGVTSQSSRKNHS